MTTTVPTTLMLHRRKNSQTRYWLEPTTLPSPYAENRPVGNTDRFFVSDTGFAASSIATNKAETALPPPTNVRLGEFRFAD